MTNQPAAIGSYVDWYGKSPNDVEVAIHVSIVDVQPIMDVHGAPLEPLDALIVQLQRMDKQLVGHGFKRSDRLDKPTYGGGGARGAGGRPEDKPPTDIPVPEHCGEKAVYKAAWTGKDGKEHKPKFECRKAKACAEMTEGGKQYPWSVWEDAYRKKLDSTTAMPPGKPAEATDDKPVNWAPFFRECTNLGVTKEEVWRIAGVVSQTELLAKVKTPEKLDQLLERVKRARPAA